METRKMDMPLPAHARLTQVRDLLRARTGRKGLTFGEAVEWLCDRFEAELVTEVKGLKGSQS